MPYIDQFRRTFVEFTVPQNAGELNYKLTKICLDFLGKDYRYQDINDVIGALEGCKLEIYRRLVGPYEDTKIEENGDVYKPNPNMFRANVEVDIDETEKDPTRAHAEKK